MSVASSPSKLPASWRVIGRSIVDWWDGWLDIVMITIVWLFAQLTIVLGPPATFGVYYAVYHMINGEATGVRGMIEGARKHFVKAWLWGILNIIAVVILYFNFVFYTSLESTFSLALVVLISIVSMFWLFTQFYALPFFMEQEDQRLRVALKNGMLTSLAAPFFTLMIMLVVIAIVFLSLGLIIPTFLGLPVLIAFLGFRALNDRLIAFGIRKAEKTPKEIEFEQGGRINIPQLDRVGDDSSGAADAEISDGEGQVK
jgi:uncharacterized membrane protein YesL